MAFGHMVRRLGTSGWLVALLLAAVPSAPARAQQTHFSYDSTPGSWVGAGRVDYHVSPATNWAFSGTLRPDRGYVRLAANSLDPNAPGSDYYWHLELAAPRGQQLVPGLYENATRYPFQDPEVPGMWLSGNHRGDNVVTGWFRILEAEYSGDTILRFAADFKQYDEGNPEQWVEGQWRYNATVPEPSSLALLGVAVVLGLRPRRR